MKRLCDGGVIQPATAPDTITAICACGKSLQVTHSILGNTVVKAWMKEHRPVQEFEMLDFEPPEPEHVRRREGE